MRGYPSLSQPAERWQTPSTSRVKANSLNQQSKGKLPQPAERLANTLEPLTTLSGCAKQLDLPLELENLSARVDPAHGRSLHIGVSRDAGARLQRAPVLTPQPSRRQALRQAALTSHLRTRHTGARSPGHSTHSTHTRLWF